MCKQAVVVTLRNRNQLRIGRIDVASGAIKSDNVLVTGCTIGIRSRYRVVHGRRTVEADNRGLGRVTGCAVERSRVDAGVTIRAVCCRRRSGW